MSAQPTTEPGHRMPGGPGPIRVATVPPACAYVDAVFPEDVEHVAAVPDAASDVSPWLDPGYLRDRAQEVDVLHLHGGWQRLPAAELEEWTAAVRRSGVPLVVTVHELDRDPHGERDERLGLLLSTAEVVFTLSLGAADEIADRFGRTAIVVAHPTAATPVPDLGAERGLVGVLLGAPDGRHDPETVVRAALSGALSGGGRLRVLTTEPGELPASVTELLAGGGAELVRCTVADRVGQLQQLHVAVLSDRCGTHSRDLEICRDVGTRVVAPGCGWFAEQWSEVVGYGCRGEQGVDPVSLAAAVTVAVTRPLVRPADAAWRAEQRAAIRRVHGEVYAQVAGDRLWA